jgi:hypothetical protein
MANPKLILAEHKDCTEQKITASAQNTQTSDHQMGYQVGAFAFASQEVHFLESRTCDM